MHTLTIKIPPALEQDIARASAREHLSKSELVRRALTAAAALWSLSERMVGESFVPR